MAHIFYLSRLSENVSQLLALSNNLFLAYSVDDKWTLVVNASFFRSNDRRNDMTRRIIFSSFFLSLIYIQGVLF